MISHNFIYGPTLTKNGNKIRSKNPYNSIVAKGGIDVSVLDNGVTNFHLVEVRVGMISRCKDNQL